MLRKAFFTALTIAASALALPQAANAIVVTLDNPIVTVVRPAAGTLSVDFTGHIDITPDFELASFSRSGMWNAAGDRTFGSFATPTFATDGVLFRVTIDSTDLGLYNLDFDLVGLAWFVYAECPIAGGFCNNTGRINFGVNVLDQAPTGVPEPLSLSLVGLALLGVGFARRQLTPAVRPR